MSVSSPFDRPHDHPGAEKPIAELLRLAGHRPQPSTRRTEEARAAVDAEWSRTVRRRHARRLVWRMVAAAMALLAFGWVARLSIGTAPPPTALATVASVRAPVQARSGESEARALRVGDVVMAGTAIDSGAAGRTALRLASGASIRLDVDSRVVLESASLLRLTRGAVYVDSHGRASTPGLQVQTSQGLVREIGTQFEVRAADAGIRIRVREGDVRLDRPDISRTSVVVTQAEELRVAASGAVERRTIPRHGPEWAWVEAITPPFTIEGASLESFLQWASREAGWTWRFKDGAASRHGATVVLHGSIEDLTPAEALDAVLPTCGMAGHVRDGQLVVSLAN